MTVENSLEVRLLPPHAQKRVYECPKPRDRMLLLLGLDAGCRITEAVQLKWEQVSFVGRFIRVRSLKKGDNSTYRDVPMTPALFRAAADWFEKSGCPDGAQPVFPPKARHSETQHLTRYSAHRRFKKLVSPGHSFHDLRHTCLTKLLFEGGADIFTVQKIAGHKSFTTTEIYTHVPQSKIRAAFDNLEKRGLIERLRRRFFPKKEVHVVPVSVGQFKYHVGRAREIAQLRDLMDKRVNVYLKGSTGTGKTQLLDALKDDRIIRIQELKQPKKILENLIVELASRGKPVVITDDRDTELKKTLTKESIKQLTDTAIWSCEKHEFTLVIDDANHLTATGANMLEKLRDHFHVIAAAREVPTDRAHFLTNFEKIELQPLSQSESRELFERVAADLDLARRTDDYGLLRNHVLNSTGGIPLFIIQHASRYGREQWIGSHTITGLTHTASRDQSQINATPALFVVAVLLGLIKYIGRESDPGDKNAYLIIGGGAIALAIILRAIIIMRRNKPQKFV